MPQGRGGDARGKESGRKTTDKEGRTSETFGDEKAGTDARETGTYSERREKDRLPHRDGSIVEAKRRCRGLPQDPPLRRTPIRIQRRRDCVWDLGAYV